MKMAEEAIKKGKGNFFLRILLLRIKKLSKKNSRSSYLSKLQIKRT